MRRWLYPLYLLIAFFLSSALIAQKATFPNTLLWRISGKGLKAPSYLYGTMHLQNKQLFNFGDSLYKGLESVEGFALEIDFKEYLDSLITKGISRKEDELLSREEVKIDQKKVDQASDSLFKKLGLNKYNLTKKDLKSIREYRMNKLLNEGEMPTIVDGYLFGLALRQNKWIGGIEDVSDQLNLFDELGSELTPEKVLASEATLRKSFKEMIQAYVDQDIQKIGEMVNGYDAKTKDALLIKRNLKMARRMDSLSAIRSMFFAVGAAHLPGDSGVISELRHRGFSVEPVFSSQRIPAETYAEKLQALPWFKVEDENKSYTIEMPGNPSQFNEFGETVKMKMFFDLTSMTYYMTSQTIGNYDTDNDFETAMRSMVERMGGAVKGLKIKDVSTQEVKGKETNFNKDGFNFRVRLLQKDSRLFILIAGAANANRLNTGNTEHFFSSFVAHKMIVEKKDWVSFSLPDKAFSIKLPGTPKKNPSLDRQAENSSWNFTTYDYVDNARGLYYLIQIRDIKEGFYLNGDSAYFQTYVQDMKTRMDTILNVQQTLHAGFPAFYFDAIYNKNVLYKAIQVIRGNRVYLLLVGGAEKDVEKNAKDLFTSLTLDTYKQDEWSKQNLDGFSTSTPSLLRKIEQDSTDKSRQHYVAYSSNSAISFEVFKDELTPYFWSASDSAFYAQKQLFYSNEEDSIIKKEIVYNGSLKGIDLIVQRAGHNNLQKVRLLVNGNTLYTLTTFVASQYIESKSTRAFFDDFRIAKEIAPSIYTSKAEILLRELQSKDSLQFEKASEVFHSIQFTKDDLPFLHKILLQHYPDSFNNNSIYDKCMRYISNFNDESTLQFVANHYNNLGVGQENIKYDLLQLLATHKTAQSFALIKELLRTKPPTSGNVFNFANALMDTMELTTEIYPSLLPLATDSVFSDALAKITWQLMDSGLIKKETLADYEKTMIQQARLKFDAAQKSGVPDDWYYYSWSRFLQRLNSPEANHVLQTFQGSSSFEVMYYTIEALLKNKQPIEPPVLEKLAAEKKYRNSLFNLLKEAGQQHLFPTRYNHQKSLAESEMYAIASDDYEPQKIEFISERETMFMGQKKRFYLYKIEYDFEEEGKETYLGIAGPYLSNAKELITETELSGLSTELFNAKQIDQQLKKYLTDLESIVKE